MLEIQGAELELSREEIQGAELEGIPWEEPHTAPVSHRNPKLLLVPPPHGHFPLRWELGDVFWRQSPVEGVKINFLGSTCRGTWSREKHPALCPAAPRTAGKSKIDL